MSGAARRWALVGVGTALVALALGVRINATVGWSVLVAGLAGLGFFLTSSPNLQVAGWMAGINRGLGLVQVLIGFVLRLLLVTAVFAVGVARGLSPWAMGVTLLVVTVGWIVVLIVGGLAQRTDPPVA